MTLSTIEAPNLPALTAAEHGALNAAFELPDVSAVLVEKTLTREPPLPSLLRSARNAPPQSASSRLCARRLMKRLRWPKG